MVRFACFNRDDSEICTVNLNGNVQIWNCKTGKIVAQLRAAFQSSKGMCDIRSVKWNSTGNKIVASILKDVRIWARYDDATLSQILLKTVLNLWLQLKKPSKEIDSPKKMLDTVAQLLLCDQGEIDKTWQSFPENMQQAIWLSMHKKIQRYGK
jgi:WD40 repeat protein